MRRNPPSSPSIGFYSHRVGNQRATVSLYPTHCVSPAHPLYCSRQLSFATRKKSTKSNTQKASLQEKRNTLTSQVRRWRELQSLYMPGAVTPSFPMPDDDADEDNGEKVDDVSLVLPSALQPEQRLAICRHRVAEHERQFRLAQLEDSLVELRRVRRIRRTLLMNHRIQIAGRGRRANTRSRSVIDSIEQRINRFTQRYRAAYKALLQLDPSGIWQETYLELKDCDNRGPGKEAEERGVGDGSYAPSWIWMSNPRARNPSGATDADEDATDEEVNDAMRVEWATSFARMERWAEEVELLQEEMRRVVAFLEWKSTDWLTKREARSALVTPDIQSGLDAYARKQAGVYRDLATSFSMLWRPTLVSYNLNHSWATACLQRHGVSPAETDIIPTPRDRGIFKLRILSDMNHSQPDAPSTPQDHDPSGARNIGEDSLLDEANSDSSTGAVWSETDGSETDGSKTDGSKTDGSKTDGSDTEDFGDEDDDYDFD